jgi:hypothetical protein
MIPKVSDRHHEPVDSKGLVGRGQWGQASRFMNRGLIRLAVACPRLICGPLGAVARLPGMIRGSSSGELGRLSAECVWNGGGASRRDGDRIPTHTVGSSRTATVVGSLRDSWEMTRFRGRVARIVRSGCGGRMPGLRGTLRSPGCMGCRGSRSAGSIAGTGSALAAVGDQGGPRVDGAAAGHGHCGAPVPAAGGQAGEGDNRT